MPIRLGIEPLSPPLPFRFERLRETKICDKETDEISASSDSDIAQIGRIDLSPIATINVGIHILLFSLFVTRGETKLTHFRLEILYFVHLDLSLE